MRLELFSQTGNRQLDGVARQLVAEFGKRMFELSLWNDAPGFAHENFENGSLARREPQIDVRAVGEAGRNVESEPSDRQNWRLRIRRTPQQRAASGEKFAGVERLDEIIVCAGVQS